MLQSHGLVLLYAQCPDFIQTTRAALAMAGVRCVSVASRELLLRVIRDEGPALALLHWDSLEGAALHCACVIKSGTLKRMAQVALVTAGDGRSGRGRMTALASGADDLIEGDTAELVAHVRGLLRWHPQLEVAAQASG